ncbi:MarR family transcriptional regulator [Streptomyces sp. NBC_01218]|uniref:MarR family winged helix-turn-helix transcriptional regulator n=1 Tax=Streptomyces sp. NBC_01218 TaxID=2903780 RepID=UPI002E10689B|nr:MarR family transcriptional regulator [Streptomyces sp. NBC_01218]
MSHSTPDTENPPGRPAAAERLRNLGTRLLSLAAIRSDRLVNERLARAGARKWHYAALATLEEFGPASQAELSRRTGIHRSDMVAVINELAARGLVARTPNPADRRQNVVSATPQGTEHLRELDAVLAEVEDEVLSPLTAPEREQLARLLAALVERPDRTM